MEDSGASVTYEGTWSAWTNPGLSGGRYVWTNSDGAATIRFDGVNFEWVTCTGPQYGIGALSIDGGPEQLVDLYAPELALQESVYATATLEPGSHVATMRWTGTRNDAASNTIVGFDAAGVDAAFVDVRAEEGTSLIAVGGRWQHWRNSRLSSGEYMWTNGPRGVATIAFEGTRFSWVTCTAPSSGIAEVSIDGGPPTTVDLYAPSLRFQQVVFSADVAEGSHTVSIRWTGLKNPASSGTYVGIDAVSFKGQQRQATARVEQNDSPMGLDGAWTTWTNAALSGGDYAWTGDRNGSVTIAFEGSSLAWRTITGPNFGIASVSVDGGPASYVDLYAASHVYDKAVYTTGELTPGRHTVRIGWTGSKNPAATAALVGVDSFDIAGRIQPPPYEDADTRILYVGTWTPWNSGTLSGGSYRWMNRRGAAAIITFRGSRLDWLTCVAPSYGIANVSVDGGPKASVDLYSPSLKTQQRVWSTGNLGYGTHTVRIDWTGRRNPASSGTYVGIDRLDVSEGALVPTITFSYPWHRYIVIDKSDFRLYQVQGGVVQRSYPVAIGRPGMETPVATWRIDAKYYSDPKSVYGPRKMRLFRQSGSRFVYTSYLIHGTNEPWVIGTKASHGCIRMYNEDVLDLFPLVPLHTMVVTRQ